MKCVPSPTLSKLFHQKLLFQGLQLLPFFLFDKFEGLQSHLPHSTTHTLLKHGGTGVREGRVTHLGIKDGLPVKEQTETLKVAVRSCTKSIVEDVHQITH